jgi:hypothetical protein
MLQIILQQEPAGPAPRNTAISVHVREVCKKVDCPFLHDIQPVWFSRSSSAASAASAASGVGAGLTLQPNLTLTYSCDIPAATTMH